MNLDHDFVQVSKLSEDQKKVFTKNGTLFFLKIQVKTKKKRSLPKMEHIFLPNSSEHLRSDAHQSQTIGGDTAKLLGGYIPPGFGTPVHKA